jgi:type II secretory pathway pseudopilin PulG
MSTPPSSAPEPSPRPTGYQPIETEGFPWTGLTLVLVVLGLIAFMAVPTGPISPAARSAERLEYASRQALGEFRSAIRDYYLDHRHFPGRNPRASARSGAGARWLERQLRLSTDADGNPAGAPTPDHPFGPYLPGGLPINPVNGEASVLFLDQLEGFTPDNSSGWVYSQDEGVVRMNSSSRLRGSSSRYFDL